MSLDDGTFVTLVIWGSPKGGDPFLSPPVFSWGPDIMRGSQCPSLTAIPGCSPVPGVSRISHASPQSCHWWTGSRTPLCAIIPSFILSFNSIFGSVPDATIVTVNSVFSGALLISSSQLVLSSQWTCKLIQDRIHCITWEMLAEGTTMHGPDYPVCPSWSSKMGRNSCVVYGVQVPHYYSLRGPWTWSSCHRHWSSLRSAVAFWTLNFPEQSSGLPQSPRCQQGQLFPFPPIRWWTVPGQCHPWHIGSTQ